jgi:hypothetical protein
MVGFVIQFINEYVLKNYKPRPQIKAKMSLGS